MVVEYGYLVERFRGVFSDLTAEPVVYFSPGRINLIGEHIDYNGGYVFPAAITFGTYGVVAPRMDSKVVLYSGNFESDGVIEFDLFQFEKGVCEPWSIYAKGVVAAFQKAGYTLEKGFNAYIEGNIPNGAGLSSSASLELLVAEILADLNGLEVDMMTKVKLSQWAENEYVGVNCGIMDQFAIGMGQAGKAIQLNTDSLTYQYADCDLQDCKILIMNTNKQRELADSKYNERRAECDAAAELLKTAYLCDLDSKELAKAVQLLELNDTLYRRAKHAVTENERVKLAIEALAQGDLPHFGELLNKSHRSLRDDYEVTGKELDTIVELAWEQPGVLGARMTGAGFGGCAIALVKEDVLEEVQAQIAKGYEEKIGYPASFYVAAIGGGTRKL